MGTYLVYHAPDTIDQIENRVPYFFGMKDNIELSDIVQAYVDGMYSQLKRIEASCVAYAYMMAKGSDLKTMSATFGDIITCPEKQETYLITRKGLLNISSSISKNQNKV